MKRCSACGVTKLLAEFSTSLHRRSGKRYSRGRCKPCRAAVATSRYRAKRAEREASGEWVRFSEWGERFLLLVDATMPDECWEWQGFRDPKGYGHIGIAGTQWSAHRISYALHNGNLPEGAFICHHCDNPSCVNPAHLYAGDVVTNAADMVQRGRLVVMRGEAAGSSKLSEAEMREVRDAYATGLWRQRDVALMYGISQSQVSHIVTGQQWSHVS